MKNTYTIIIILISIVILFDSCDRLLLDNQNQDLSKVDNTNNESTKSNKELDLFSEVKIGKQTWMSDNLNVDRFRNGDPIQEVRSLTEWKKAYNAEQPAYCYYKYNQSYGSKFGKLYNIYAVNDTRGLAPKGWHIPSLFELNQLIKYLGHEPATKMKNTNGWKSRGSGTNESGFSALPSGQVSLDDESFDYNYFSGYFAYWWTSIPSTLYGSNYSFEMHSSDVYIKIKKNYYNSRGYSVRCIKD